MDRTQGIGVLLIFLVIIAYYLATAPTQEEIARYEFVQDSIAKAKEAEETFVPTKTQTTPTQEQVVNDSIQAIERQSKFGVFSTAIGVTDQTVQLENDLVAITFAAQGGKIKQVRLKKHDKIIENEQHEESKTELLLLEDEKNKFEYLIPTKRYGNINTSELSFTPMVKDSVVTLTAKLSDGGSLIQKYTLHSKSYKVDYALILNGLEQHIDTEKAKLRFRWHNYLDRIELNTNFEKYYSTVYFKEVDESSSYCNCRGDDKEEIFENKIEWVSHVNQFFNTSIVAVNKKFENGLFETISSEEESKDLKLIKTEYDIPLDLVSNEVIQSKLYIGPNEFNRLSGYGEDLEQIIPFGRSIFGSINRWVIRPAFNFFASFIGSKGIVIILLIFIIKMLLYPLMYKMLHSQAKMGLLKPEIAQLKEKHDGDQQKVQMETMKLYREYGVSPLGGCMPMIIQMPIWYALFRFFPASITFRQEPFLWATDLSSYDVLFRLPFEIPAFGAHVSLFTILWAVSTIIYSVYNMKHMDMSANPAMKYVQYFMPITFLFFFNTYASGLTCYMFFSNLFNIGQTLFTKKFVFDDNKLRAELEKQKNKPKKKGGFQSRLEEAMRQQQQVQKQKASQAKKKKRK